MTRLYSCDLITITEGYKNTSCRDRRAASIQRLELHFFKNNIIKDYSNPIFDLYIYRQYINVGNICRCSPYPGPVLSQFQKSTTVREHLRWRACHLQREGTQQNTQDEGAQQGGGGQHQAEEADSEEQRLRRHSQGQEGGDQGKAPVILLCCFM